MNRLDSSFNHLNFDLSMSIPRVNRSFHTKSISSTLSLVEVRTKVNRPKIWHIKLAPCSLSPFLPFFPFSLQSLSLIFPSSSSPPQLSISSIFFSHPVFEFTCSTRPLPSTFVLSVPICFSSIPQSQLVIHSGVFSPDRIHHLGHHP